MIKQFINQIEYIGTDKKNENISVELSVNNIIDTYNLPSVYKQHIREYLSLLKIEYADKTYEHCLDTLGDKLEVLRNSIRMEAAKGLYGGTGHIQRNLYRRHIAARAQLLANVNLTVGEIKLPETSYKELLKYFKGIDGSEDDPKGWTTSKSINIDDVNNLLSKRFKDLGITNEFKIKLTEKTRPG